MRLLLDLDELEKGSGSSIGYRPTIEAVCVPIDQIVTLVVESLPFGGSLWIPFAADEQADVMVLELIDQNRNVFAPHIVDTSADQLETLIDFTSEPRLHGMLVARFDIDQVRTNQRANMIRSDFGHHGWRLGGEQPSNVSV
jgi:hypothetical protein